MGMHQSVYMGAYLLVPHAEQTETQEAYACSANCGNQAVDRRTRFCSACGAPVIRQDKVIKKKGPLQVWALLGGAYEDAFWSPEGGQGRTLCLWLPNQRGYGKSADSDCDPDNLQDLDPQYFAQCKEALLRDYADLIRQVKAEFGVEARVQAGVLSYWS